MISSENALRNYLDNLKIKYKKWGGGDTKIICFGLGNTMELYRNAFFFEDILPDYYSDNNEKKWNTTINGIKVISPREIKLLEKALVVICTMDFVATKEIEAQLDKFETAHIRIDEFICMQLSNEILENLNLFADSRSCEVYSKVILSRLKHENIPNEIVEGKQYFAIPQFDRINSAEVFADVGAYVGDSVERYIYQRAGVFKKIYAFEPGEKNFKALCYRIERLQNEWALDDNKISCVFNAVGVNGYAKKSDSIRNCLSSCSAEDEDMIEIVSLDDYFKDIKITFLKADIESYEMKMLEGAKNIIYRDTPKLAICIYHNMSDFVRIPQYIASLKKDYKMAIRHHSYKYSETVLYAWNNEN